MTTISAEREQSMSALVDANRIRILRAELKRDLCAGTVRFSELVLDPPSWALSAMIWEIALVVPHVGPSRVKRAFRSMNPPMDPWATFGALSVSRRVLLARLVEGWRAG